MKTQNNNEYVGYIYIRTLICTGLKYVGQTVDIEHRNSQWRDTNNPYAGKKINKARKENGVSDTDWLLEVIEIKAPTKKDRAQQLDYLEEIYIIKNDSVNNGYNQSYGRGMKGLHHTLEAKAKISQKLTGIKRSAETKRKISEAAKLRWAKQKQSLQQAATTALVSAA